MAIFGKTKIIRLQTDSRYCENLKEVGTGFTMPSSMYFLFEVQGDETV